ncbi:MAG: TolC family protein [Vicinamibacterales bacterium]
MIRRIARLAACVVALDVSHAASVRAHGQPALEVPEILAAVDRAFPLIEAARHDQDQAEAVVTEARGAFDLKFKGEVDTLQGYYGNDRFKGTLEQPLTALGITAYGGYRVGRGTFAPYDEKALTLSDGEFSGGLVLPLLRDRAIDGRRATLRVSEIGVQVSAQAVSKTRLTFFKDAAKLYWDWVASARQLAVARGLLELAERRDADLAEAVALGQVAPVERTDNVRAILQRRSALVTAQRVVEASAIALSLYYRGPDGRPIRPPITRIPDTFPDPAPLSAADEDTAVTLAVAQRPEVLALRLKREQQRTELQVAANTLLPSLNLFADLSRDVGGGRPSRAGSEFAGGLRVELPFQRRKASGKVGQATAKLGALDAELRFAEDRVRADVQDTASAVRAAYAAVEIVRQELAVARDLEGLERDRFQLGDSTQFLVNLRELNTADAAFREVKALADYQKARVEFEAASGLLLDRVATP